MIIGFLVNPIAGMGGRVGLKGTDGVADRAREMGAKPVAGKRAEIALTKLANIASDVEWLTCSGQMGEKQLRGAGHTKFKIVHQCSEDTAAKDTMDACAAFLANGAELVLFCGGDGTARNVFEVVGDKVPILGIPAGVKMHSAVFGINPERCADILQEYLDGKIGASEAEVMDLDEGLYRKGEWQLEIFGYAMTPHEPAYVQAGKFMVTEVSDDEAKEDIARHVIEEMEKEPGALFVLGPGSTLRFIGNELGIEKTLLGIDTVMDGKMVARDVNEKALLDLLDKNADVRLVISPIGAQGFILGRGNHQLSPEVLKRVGVSDVWVVSTPAKLKRTPVLRIDTGDKAVDEKFTKINYIFVITGYREKVMRRVER